MWKALLVFKSLEEVATSSNILIDLTMKQTNVGLNDRQFSQGSSPGMKPMNTKKSFPRMHVLSTMNKN